MVQELLERQGLEQQHAQVPQNMHLQLQVHQPNACESLKEVVSKNILENFIPER